MFFESSSKRWLGLAPIFARLRSAVAWLRQAWLEALAEATLSAIELGLKLGASRKSRLLTTSLAGLSIGLRAQAAQANTPAGNACGASGSATSSIAKVFQNVGSLLYIIGGIFSLVCFAGAALMLMGIDLAIFHRRSGGSIRHDPESRHKRAMGWAKNTLWGLALLAGGFFLRSIVVHFTLESDQAHSPGLGEQPAVADLTNCEIPKAS
jgi:hypothetical protein